VSAEDRSGEYHDGDDGDGTWWRYGYGARKHLISLELLHLNQKMRCEAARVIFRGFNVNLLNWRGIWSEIPALIAENIIEATYFWQGRPKDSGMIRKIAELSGITPTP
jgi:hypothetical protein